LKETATYEQTGMSPYSPQQPSPESRKMWYRRYPATVIGLGVLAASVALGGPAHAATATAHPTCQAQAKGWLNGGAKHQLAVLQADLKTPGSDTQKFAADVNKGSSTSGRPRLQGIQRRAHEGQPENEGSQQGRQHVHRKISQTQPAER
jgi:hypothetical protein